VLRKFALSSAAYSRYKLDRAVRHAALAGYSGIGIIADAPHGYPPSLTDADRKAVRSVLARQRLAVSNINAAPMTALRDELRPSWVESDRVLRQERIQHTLDAARLAKDLGAVTVSTLGGGEIEEEMDRPTAAAHFVAGLKRVACEIAKKNYPPVLIDPQEGLLIETLPQALEIADQFKPDAVGVNVNTGNFHRAGQDAAAAIRELRERVRHVHIEDVAADGSGAIVVPGTGQVDFAPVFAAVDEVGYTGWLTIDLAGADAHPDDAARQALEFLRQFDK